MCFPVEARLRYDVAVGEDLSYEPDCGMLVYKISKIKVPLSHPWRSGEQVKAFFL